MRRTQEGKARRWSVAVGVLCATLFGGCDRFNGNEEFTDLEWQRLSELSLWNDADPEVLRGIGKPPGDPSNLQVPPDGYPVAVDGTLAPAAALGKLFFFDSRFSGPATASDWVGRVRPENAHIPMGTPINLACVSCHDLNRAASDPLELAISVGAGSIAANAPPLSNAAFFPLLHHNGRVDSLWSQALLVTEAGIVLNASRLEVAWTIWRAYRDRYQSLFAEPPLGDEATLRDLRGRLVTKGAQSGQCQLGADGSCAGGCVAIAGAPGCWPRFPLAGAPRTKAAGETCLDPADPSPTCCVHPLETPYNCMAAADRAEVDKVFVRFGKVIAAYEQTLVRGGSAFDRFMHEGKSSQALSPAAKSGARLFVTKAGCYDCHGTPLFSNRGFANIGVATTVPLDLTTADCPAGNAACDCATGGATSLTSCLPWGALTGLELLRRFPLSRTSAASDNQQDPTVAGFLAAAWPNVPQGPPDATGIPDPLPSTLKWAWKIPSLRDVAVTAPYMHNGRYATLEEVIDHYDRGGDPQAPGVPAPALKPLLLTAEEKAALVAFLKSLTSAPWPPSISAPPTLPAEAP
jgi:cytochrome c peroxidase